MEQPGNMSIVYAGSLLLLSLQQTDFRFSLLHEKFSSGFIVFLLLQSPPVPTVNQLFSPSEPALFLRANTTMPVESQGQSRELIFCSICNM